MTSKRHEVDTPMSTLEEIRRRVERIGRDWDYDMTDRGKVIDIEGIIRDLVNYLIEREAGR